MFPTAFRVVLDANVLYPFSLRDTLLRAAEGGLYQLYWTDEILDEMCRSLARNNQVTHEKALRLRGEMTNNFPEAMVDGYADLVSAMQNHPKDRHVAAAALKAGAQVIVTANLRDFGWLPDGIEAQAPDEFLCALFDLNPALLIDLLRDQASALKAPAKTLDQLLNALARLVPGFIQCVRNVLDGESTS